jgi:hypothetical protein
MKILRPVDVNKRLPEKSLTTQVLINDRICFAIYHPEKSDSHPNGYFSIPIDSTLIGNATHWYEEVEIESLFPDDDKIYLAGEAATNKQYVKTMFFQEGASYFKNFIFKMLKK